MPKSPTKIVRCANCLRDQEDQGKRKTCPHCGCCPLPSYSYPKGCSFHPKTRPQSLTDMVAERRAAAGK